MPIIAQPFPAQVLGNRLKYLSTILRLCSRMSHVVRYQKICYATLPGVIPIGDLEVNNIDFKQLVLNLDISKPYGPDELHP